MIADIAAIDDAIERAVASASRLGHAARHSISNSAKQREQQRSSAAEAAERVAALRHARAAFVAMTAGVVALIESAPAHMCPRNAQERDAYKALRAVVAGMGPQS